jgi:hypothetical protein
MRFRIELTIAVMGHTRRLCRFARSRGFRARAQPRYKYRQTGFETIILQMNDHRKKSKPSKAKTILRLPDLEQSKSAVLIRSQWPVRKNHTVMPSTSSSGGIVLSRV